MQNGEFFEVLFLICKSRKKCIAKILFLRFKGRDQSFTNSVGGVCDDGVGDVDDDVYAYGHNDEDDGVADGDSDDDGSDVDDDGDGDDGDGDDDDDGDCDDGTQRLRGFFVLIHKASAGHKELWAEPFSQRLHTTVVIHIEPVGRGSIEGIESLQSLRPAQPPKFFAGLPSLLRGSRTNMLRGLFSPTIAKVVAPMRPAHLLKSVHLPCVVHVCGLWLAQYARSQLSTCTFSGRASYNSV